MDPQCPGPDLLVSAYCRGIFPMVDSEGGEIQWFSPDPRGNIRSSSLWTFHLFTLRKIPLFGPAIRHSKWMRRYSERTCARLSHAPGVSSPNSPLEPRLNV